MSSSTTCCILTGGTIAIVIIILLNFDEPPPPPPRGGNRGKAYIRGSVPYRLEKKGEREKENCTKSESKRAMMMMR